MSSLFIDGIIYLLLLVSAGFGGISVIGLLLFPDIRSRMYSATRASIICISAITVSVLTYASFILISGGGNQYGTLFLHTLVLFAVTVVANVMLYKIISDRIKNPDTCRELP